MKATMSDAVVRNLSAGLSQKGVRNHNERLVLTLLQRHGALPGSDLARLALLSPPTVSAILRKLEAEGLIERGEPTKGKVGKPSIPMRLAADATFSFGFKIGRRSAELILLDFVGEIRERRKLSYLAPSPGNVFSFLRAHLRELSTSLPMGTETPISGIGVAAPFDLWSWQDHSTSELSETDRWRTVDLRQELTAITDLPVFLVNDATAACQAEHIYGRGREFRDYAYFFVGAYVGGGVVLNNSVFEGRQGNAGALGSVRAVSPLGESAQLVDLASIHVLEERMRELDLDPTQLWEDDESWTRHARLIDFWIGQTAQELAKASLSVCSVIDFEAILIDGAFPPHIRKDLTQRVERYILNQDTRGLIRPQIVEGTVGRNARSIGAATRPTLAQFFLNSNAGLGADPG